MKMLFLAAAKVAQIQFASTPRQLIHPPNGSFCKVVQGMALGLKEGAWSGIKRV